MTPPIQFWYESTVHTFPTILSQMVGQDDLGTLPHEEIDGRHGGADAIVVGDVLAVVQQNVQIGMEEHLLPPEVLVAQGAHAPLGRHFLLGLPFPAPNPTP